MKHGKWMAAALALCLFFGTITAVTAVSTEEYGAAEEQGRENASEYFFYDVSTRFLTDREVEALNAQQACYAKNEVYAIHGRKFVSVELQEYFGSKSWYKGTIEPSEFTDRVFNKYELANIQALVKREEELCPGGYPLDKAGYDISLAGTASGNDTSADTPQKRDTVNLQRIDEICKDNYIPDESSVVFDDSSQSYYVKNEILIFFSMDATPSEKEQVFSYLDGELVGGSPELNMYQVLLSENKSLDGLSSTADDIAERFDCVVYATYDSVTIDPENAYVPNDPWDKDVSDEDWEDTDVDGSNWWIEAIDCQGAWDYRDEYSKITIGICDTSFDVGHEDLKNRVSFPNDVLKFRNDDKKNDHGTHITGIIGAEGDNKKGITGIVQNCDILLAPIYRNENMENFSAFDSSIYANIAYLVKAGANVINLSQGKTNFLNEDNGKIQLFDDAVIEREGNLASIVISQLIQDGFKDFLVVQSSGNGTYNTGRAVDAIQNGWFASITSNSITGNGDILIDEILSHVIIVGAVEQTSTGYRCASDSNYGSQVNIVAPGERIYSTFPGGTFQFFGGYEYRGGTSVAAPMVTGVCSLVWSINPDLSSREVKDIVCKSHNTVVPSHPDTGENRTYSMVNARLSVEAARSYSSYSELLNKIPDTIPADAVVFNGHYYYLFEDANAASYDDALQHCIDNGGYLATITSQEENDFVYSYITGVGCESAYFGLSDASSEGNWQWCTGENVSYLNWHSGEPNNKNSNENYAMFYNEYGDSTWNDGDFGSSAVNGGNAFICEWGDYTLSENSPDDSVIAIDKSVINEDRYKVPFFSDYEKRISVIEGTEIILDLCPVADKDWEETDDYINIVSAEISDNNIAQITNISEHEITILGVSSGLSEIYLNTFWENLESHNRGFIEKTYALEVIPASKDSEVINDDSALSSPSEMAEESADESPTEYGSAEGYEYYLTKDGTLTITSYVGTDQVLQIPDKLNGAPVKRIAKDAFSYRTDFRSIVIPEGVKSIGDYAFYDCPNLSSLRIPASLTSIGISDFERCPSLKMISVSEDNPIFTFQSNALYQKDTKEILWLPAGLELESFEIPKGIRAIRGGAFAGCYSLTSITIPESVTSIGDRAFYGCENLTITVSQGSYAAEYCEENGLNYTCPDVND